MKGSLASIWFTAALLSSSVREVLGYRYDERYVGYNLNENKTATNPLDYWGEWEGHDYHKSPGNWRFPFYTLFIDKFVNGDPTNDNANETLFEHDMMQTQLRHGGDLKGLVDSLDYIAGMGVRGIYIAGSPMINAPWGADMYSPLDLSVLDAHLGNMEEWRQAVQAIHDKGMYVLLDNTVATMGDLIAFNGFLNESTPFRTEEHQVQWRNPKRQYHDFHFGNTYNTTCHYPRFWLETGFAVKQDVTDRFHGCYESDFDQYGDTEAFGVFPDWQRQLSKFASVQDRLREWVPSVNERIARFACMWITQLDIDGIRIDKATQATVDALGDFSHIVRKCATKVGKDNFFITGEITGGNTFGAIYLGRGRQPDMQPKTIGEAVRLNKNSSLSYFIRDPEKVALDSAAFHYSIYRSLTRFLGMSGNLAAGYDVPVNWISAWNEMLLTNDMVNPSTGVFDPRHMYGTTNQDVFRWPAIQNGTQRMLLGMFVTTLLLPGIPLLLWGEEQAFYALDNTAANYVFGRQAMSSAFAWELHGCYTVGSAQYRNFAPINAQNGCKDPGLSKDHRDPSAPVRNIIKHMNQMRDNFPVLNDGWFLQQLSNRTRDILYPGSNKTTTETGLWSVLRSQYFGVQELNKTGGAGDQYVWLVYHNENQTVRYNFDCSDEKDALISPFPARTTVKNLFYPFDEVTLDGTSVALGINNETTKQGCISDFELPGWGFKAYVPKAKWVGPGPMVTKFLPGHDFRVPSAAKPGEQESIAIEFHFSEEMKCDDFRSKIEIVSKTEDGTTAEIDNSTVSCGVVPAEPVTDYVGSIPTTWKFKANLTKVSNGLHSFTLRNLTQDDGKASTDAIDKFFFRVGQPDNPIVFQRTANYTRGLLHKDAAGKLYISHKAAGADMFRYSTNWASTWSPWEKYTGGNTTIERLPWSGTKNQAWEGDHVQLQYFSSMSGSSDYMQHGDLDRNQQPRRLPHIYAHGPFNLYGYDNGVKNRFELHNGQWEYSFMTEWPAVLQLNVWGMNPDGKPDNSFVFGDMDNDGVLDRMPPSSLSTTLINITEFPPAPYLAYKLVINDGTYQYGRDPYGSRKQQMILVLLLWIIPVITGALSIWLFMKSFYSVKFNKTGVSESHSLVPLALRRALKKHNEKNNEKEMVGLGNLPMLHAGANASNIGLDHDAGAKGRRTVLIATMEYDIEDWEIKIKIGGLGVMAQLMGKNLGHQDLIWVVPCVGGIDYPEDRRAEPMHVTILGISYVVEVQYHTLRNITYVLLDAPVFRAQSKSEPYPARMDDLDSAVYYSAWNQCVALAIQRFPVDLYHINDYHGAVAPLHLLPQTIPVCLSLHNAEFQGLWPMRTNKEKKEVCAVYNLPEEVVLKYVQFGDVFNLLHSGSSYLRIHQKGFGAVGVSAKYGKRSWARYPIFWGLSKIGKLPNPDPSDTGEWSGTQDKSEVVVNQETESSRGDLRMQAQEWAGLDKNPDADLLVFVGRWSMQKGIDLIADVMPAVLDENPNVQLICVGPVIDLYGKFAALKLDVLMNKYRGRVFSKPEFTALPPFIFSGAEFALIPSRDEPFGLVAVEFGRKGALGIGARVGGLGQMPGWWYTVESTTTTHLIHQFKMAIKDALSSKLATRQMMRARSAKQRFPVVQWVNDLETLQSKAIEIHDKEALKGLGLRDEKSRSFLKPKSGIFSSPNTSSVDVRNKMFASPNVSVTDFNSGPDTRPGTPNTIEPPAPGTGLSRKLSLGYKSGPGHSVPRRRFQGNTLSVADSVADGSEIDEDERDYRRGEDEYVVSAEDLEAERLREQQARANSPGPGLLTPTAPNFPFPDSPRGRQMNHFQDDSLSAPNMRSPALRSPSLNGSPGPEDILLPPSVFGGPPGHRASTLSLSSVVGDKTDFKLQKVDPFFQDTQGEYYRAFEKGLQNLDSKNSENLLCIEDYLVKSEKKWFDKFRDAKLGRGSATPSKVGTPTIMSRRSSIDSFMNDGPAGSHPLQNSMMVGDGGPPDGDQFLLGVDYVPPTGLRLFMQYRIGTWPVYSFFLAFGQIIAANSYQITLLSGTVGQTAERLYVTASIYLAFSVFWWNMFVYMKSIYVLSVPFIFYGLAFFMLSMAPFVGAESGREWMQNVATGMYAIAASSGSIFFALNFGDEGGSPIKDWAYRACIIQGSQQVYVCALWFWGDYLNRRQAQGRGQAAFNSSNIKMTAVTLPIAVLMWGVGVIMFTGLPNYYRQAPGKVPSFYASLFRRKIILWFFVTVLIQNFFLSTLYGRNWLYLFSSRHAATWQIVCLIVFFFGFVWAAFLYFFGWLSKDHSWIIPIFAIGLGAPRWCQMLWSCTPIGQYVPWVGSPLASALFSRSLWLWLGTLDAIQGVGFGMLLLQTLTRIHIAFTLIAAQVLGSIATICARAFAPNNVGPGDVFPDFTGGIYPGIGKAWFWVGLLAQLAICGGFFTFFRKEQLSKP